MSFYLSVVISVVSRLIPHPANFTPIGSLILLNSRKYSWMKGILLIVLAMVISDVFLHFSFASIFVYLGFASYALWGQVKKLNPIAGVFLGSVSFFLISNFGVWLGPWYEHNLRGLISCFTLALPFYRNTILADLVFVTGFVILGSLYKKFKNKIHLEEELIWLKSLKVAILRRK